MSEGTITAHVIETGESAYAVDIEVSGHRLKGDEPLASGGGDLGPAPYDTLLAALGECTAMTVRWYALQQHWPLEKVEVRLTHRKEERRDLFTKAITLHGEGLSDEQRAKLMAVAAKCPVQRTLEGTPLITTQADG
ncbi:MAG: OsmC family protein [Alphaproteobacteria bacterium]